jgi:predicted dehydrogenase
LAGVNVAIVGAGVIAQRYAERIAEVDGLTLVAVTDVVRERADALAAKHGAAAYASLDELLAAPDVETVINLTIPTKHVAVTRAALEAGKHVHTEKPVALRAEEAHALAGLARERGVRLSCAPATLLGTAQQTAWKLIRDGGLGEVKVVYAEANWGLIESWHPEPESLYASGPLVDVGIYPLTIVTAMFGAVRRVTAYAMTVQPVRTRKDGRTFELETPDFWVAACEHESGVLTRLTATFWVKPSRQRGLELHGTNASLWMPTWGESNSRLLRTENGEDYEDVPLLQPAYDGIDWSLALRDLAEAIREGRPHRMSAEHAAHVVDVLNGADGSRRNGGSVAISSSFEPPPPLDWAR